MNIIIMVILGFGLGFCGIDFIDQPLQFFSIGIPVGILLAVKDVLSSHS